MKPLRKDQTIRGCGPAPGPRQDAAGEGRAPEDHVRRDTSERIISSLKDGIIYLDNTGLVSRVNPVMEELLGITEAEAVGRSAKDITGEPEICLLIALRSGVTKDTFRLKGREFEVEGVEVFDDDGERTGTVTLFRDVTEKRMLERQRSEVMSMITHDLKAPLTAVIGHADLILEGSLGEVPPDIRDSVEAIARGGDKVLSIIDDFLTISKLEAGLMQPVFDRADIGLMAGEAVSAVGAEAGLKGHRIELDISPGLVPVQCDPAQIERVIANLVNNAVKFTPRNGRITVGAAPADDARVRELTGGECQLAGPCVELYVEDDGVGIPPAELPYLFDRYWRGGGAGYVKGTGLGLAIVKSIVASHHGIVGVKSMEKKGSRFHVLLPVSQPVPE